jgi:hypothetical protein
MKMAKKKGNFSKLIVSFVVVANIIFTASVLWVFLKTSAEPSTLIGSWFAFTTVELWSLASIKKQKINKEGDNHDI